MERLFMPEHKAWLFKALGDLRSAKKLFKDDDETLDSAAYHTQQCVEKALKAFLVFNHKTPPKTHDLEKLLEQCVTFDQSLKSLVDDVITLIPFATYSRYADDYFEVCRSDVEAAIIVAHTVLKLINGKINVKPDPTLVFF